MQITRAVITAAGRGARQYPASNTVQKAMLPVVDRDGLTKPVLQIIAEEALESGIEEICVVSAPGDAAVYRAHFRDYAANLRSAFKGGTKSRPAASSISSNGDDLTQAPEKVAAAVRALAPRVPTYVTTKDVKRRWGHGQEDVFPVAQFEKLWGDLTFAARPSLRLSRRPPPAGTAAQGCGTASRLGHRRQPRSRRIPLRFPTIVMASGRNL